MQLMCQERQNPGLIKFIFIIQQHVEAAHWQPANAGVGFQAPKYIFYILKRPWDGNISLIYNQLGKQEKCMFFVYTCMDFGDLPNISYDDLGH